MLANSTDDAIRISAHGAGGQDRLDVEMVSNRLDDDLCQAVAHNSSFLLIGLSMWPHDSSSAPA